MSSSYTSVPVEFEPFTSNWPNGDGSRIQTEHLNYFMTNDDEYFYLRIDFKSTQVYQNIERYGFTVYFDAEDKFKRSFGITYPSGFVNQLVNVPGAYRAFFENPGWENAPENLNLIESIENNQHQQAMLMQRTDKNSSERPSFIGLNQLHAQGINLALDQSSRNMSIAFKVPLESSRFHQFALDTKPGEQFNMGFEVKAPSLDEIDPDKDIDDDTRQRIAYQLPSTFERWMSVKLAHQ
ncbi:MAG: hypothetical protein WD491_14100 [Balneolales bacterium]